MKVTVIGAGSTYTPELIEGLLGEAESLGIKTVCLFDIDQRRLDIVGGLVKRMVTAMGSPFSVRLSLDRAEAIYGASFVLTQIRVGGQQARHDDTIMALSEGLVGQETTGFGGFGKALRTIPVMLDICADMHKFAPEAWLINFTNPAGIVTEAVLKYGAVKAIGLCNGPIGMKMNIARTYGVNHEQVELDYIGLNHLSWVRRVWISGTEVTDEVLRNVGGKAANIPELTLDSDFLEALGMIPSSYLNYFYLEDEMVEHLKAKGKTRAQEVSEIEEILLRKYQDPALAQKPQELEKRGGAYYSTVALSLVKDIHLNAGGKHIVNVQNRGAIQDLPDNVVVEINALVDSRGAHPIAVGKLDPAIRGLVQHVKAYEELTVEAAVEGDYDLALLALTSNPLVSSVNKAKRLLDKLVKHHDLGITKSRR